LSASKAEISWSRRYLPAALHERHFALLFWGQAASVLGDWFFVVALPFAALSLGASAGQVGLVLAAQNLPFLFLTIVGGAWSDRLERRRVMLACDAVRAVVQAVAGVLLITGAAELWELAALAAVYGSADAFFQPAAIGLLPATVSAENLQAGNALLSLTRNVTRLIGAPLGGVLVAALGAGEAVLLDSLSFVVSASLLARMRIPRAARSEATEPTRQAIAAGWRAVRERPWLSSFLAVFAVYCGIVLPAVMVLGPVLAERDLDGAKSWGLIQGGFAVGAIAGGLIALRWQPRRPTLVVALGLLVGSLQSAAIALGGSAFVIAVLLAVAGGAVVVAIAVWDTMVQRRVPEHLLSRVSSFDWTAAAGSLPIGMALIGPVAAGLGTEATMIGASALGVLATGAYALLRAR
jgi:predicted MFS family arabinose efflux permease